MHTLTLKVPELLHTRLNRYAKQKGLSKSEIVRLALQNYFSQEAGVRGASIYDLAQDLAGSVEAPADLSANKAYLEGYGARTASGSLSTPGPWSHLSTKVTPTISGPKLNFPLLLHHSSRANQSYLKHVFYSVRAPTDQLALCN